MLTRAFLPALWNGLANDLRLAVRQARKRALFSAACIVVLAVGLGTETAIFSVLYSAILQPLPFPDPARLVAVHNRFPLLNLPRLNASSLDYLDLREHHSLFSDAGSFIYTNLARTGIDPPVQMSSIGATASLFRTLGVKPLLGRVFNEDEERYHGPHAVLISENYWRTAFASGPQILKRSLRLNEELYPIIGVMPRSFQVPIPQTEIWVPLVFTPRMLQPQARQEHSFYMYARLAPGLTFQQASARLDQLSYRMSLQHPEDYPFTRLGWRFFLQPLARDDDGSDRFWLVTLFTAVSCLLLIVATNIAGLLAVRSTERQFDVSVRMALGASRFRIVRQVVLEVMLLAVLGGAAALIIARISLRLLKRYSPLPTADSHLGGMVLFFSLLLCLATGLACAVVPAWTASRAQTGLRLKEAGHQRTASASKTRLRYGFIVGQVAVATALLLCGGLLIRSMLRLLQTPPGFNPHQVLTMEVNLRRGRYPTAESRLQFFPALLDRVRRIPGVQAASGCSLLPFGWDNSASTFEILGRPKPRVEPYANINQVFPDFFATLQIPLLRGRNFSGADQPATEPVALIDQALANHYFRSQDPIGQFVQIETGKPYKIIGVVASIKSTALDIDSRATLYFSALQQPPYNLKLLVRSPLPDGAIETAVARSLSALDKDLPIFDVIPLEVRIEYSLQTRRFVVSLITLFAALGTLLAAVGLYALLSYTVLLRRREIGIRMALGANRRDISSLIARIGMTPVLAGIIAGSATAVALQRYLASQLYATGVWDGIAWFTVLLTVSVTCYAACLLPMWRAARLEPVTALRDE